MPVKPESFNPLDYVSIVFLVAVVLFFGTIGFSCYYCNSDSAMFNHQSIYDFKMEKEKDAKLRWLESPYDTSGFKYLYASDYLRGYRKSLYHGTIEWAPLSEFAKGFDPERAVPKPNGEWRKM